MIFGDNMRVEALMSMACPSCGGKIEIAYLPKLNAAQEGEDIRFGIAECKCREYPIVSGVLIFKQLDGSQAAIKAIKTAKTGQELEKSALIFMSERFVRLVLRFELFLKHFLHLDLNLSFWKLASFIENSPFATYAKYRFTCPSLISAMPFLPAVKESLKTRGKILDLGSGMGHLSYLLSGIVSAEDLYCADISFRGLYFTRRYMAGKGASCILLDAMEKLPFSDGFFRAVISMDALQYIDEKDMIAKEMDRTLDKSGLLVLVHIHNKFAPFRADGLPLTPEGYLKLFPPEYHFRSFAERTLMDIMFSGKGINLEKGDPTAKVNASDAISMIGSRSSHYFREYPSYFDASFSRHSRFILDPLYRKRKGKYVRVFPCNRYEEEYYLIKDYFPEMIDPDTPEEELKRKLILIPVPENYMKKGKQLNYLRLWR
jgi:ubiquinone/menaquinone biosynthesis C-methylase UbiE